MHAGVPSALKTHWKKTGPFFAEYAYTVKANYVDLWKEELPEAETKAASDGKPGEEYLSEQYPHIRFTPYLRSLASEIVGTEKRPVEIARRIYDYVTKSRKA